MKIDASVLGTRLAGSARLFFRKHGPAVLTAAGVTGFAATTYLVGRAVLKAQEPVKELRLKTEELASRELDGNYTRKDQTRELSQVWIQDGLKIARIFAPAVTTGSASVFCVIAAHGMMNRQRAALAAAYAVLDTGFRAYRQRVYDELGPEKELELYRGIRKIQKLDASGDPVEACEIDMDDVLPSPYSKFFDETNPNWSRTPEYNLLFLRSKQNYANDRLRAHGFVFLNEVYEELGMERTQAGQEVGWKLRGNHDGFVDFGIYQIGDDSSRAFVNGLEAAILLDFNVDGVITI